MTQIDWAAAKDGNFNTSGDWTGGIAPDAADVAILDAAGSASYKVTASTVETVASLQTAATATLQITAPEATAPFTATDGTGAGANQGRIEIGAGEGRAGSRFVFGGDMNNGGEILLFGANSGGANALVVDGAGRLTGAGMVMLDGLNTGSGPQNSAMIAGGSADSTLTNVSNTINGGGSIMLSSLAFTNDAKGRIDATDSGGLFVEGLSAAASVLTNSGTLEATGAGELVLDNATIANTDSVGVIAASGTGARVQISGVTISGGHLNTRGGGAIDITGASTLDGATSAVTNLGALDILGANATVEGSFINQGVITGTAGLTLDHGTILNDGTMASTDGGMVISLKSVSDVLIEEASGALDGKVVGGGGALELSAPLAENKAGTITGIGGVITGFKSIEVEAGEGWYFEGANTIDKGVTLNTMVGIDENGVLTNDGVISATRDVFLSTGGELLNSVAAQLILNGDVGVPVEAGVGAATIANRGEVNKESGDGASNIWAAVENTGQIEVASGTLNFLAPVSGSGKFTIEAGSALRFTSSVAKDEVVGFGGTNAILQLYDRDAFYAAVSGFAAGDTIDVRGAPFHEATSSLGYSGGTTSGTLTLTSVAEVVKIALLGQYMAGNFQAASDGHGGTNITFVTAPAPLASPVQGQSH